MNGESHFQSYQLSHIDRKQKTNPIPKIQIESLKKGPMVTCDVKQVYKEVRDFTMYSKARL